MIYTMFMDKMAPGIVRLSVMDNDLDLFEGQYPVPQGVSYNSYLIEDDRLFLLDTVDARKQEEWLAGLDEVLAGRKLDYLVISHMEPDHAGSIAALCARQPQLKLVANARTFAILDQFSGDNPLAQERVTVADGGTLALGSHTLHFVLAPMVHWPEVMAVYEDREKVLFSADGFGNFGSLTDTDAWADEARRYYGNIVGKYGAQVQNLLKKAAGLDIEIICPLHGPVLKDEIPHALRLYDLWSSYTPESDGIVIAYTSVYGHTKKAVEQLAETLRKKGCPSVVLHDLARCDLSQAVADAFRYNKLVLATTTYNAGVFPPMRDFLCHLTERNFQNRTVALIENGTWAPMAAKTMRQMLANSPKLRFTDAAVQIRSALSSESQNQLAQLADELCQDYLARQNETADKNDLKALFHIGYGLYVVTCRDGEKDNGLIVNTVSQVTDSPNRIAVTINKRNYSHHIIKQTGLLNVNCLSVDAPFKVFETFGFQSGRAVDKFTDYEVLRSDNGLRFLPRYINSFMSLKVEQYIDLDTHGMFICAVTEARVLSNAETMTYTYYQNYVKPKPETQGKKGFVCKICGYVYEGDTLPEDFVCPLCKHGAQDFEPIA